MLELIIYLVIGGALIALLAFLFIREGQREEQSRPQYAWEKAVEDYGDPTLISLYRRAKTDEERLEIASFVNPELNSQSAEVKAEEELLDEEPKKKKRRKRLGRKKAQEEAFLAEEAAEELEAPAEENPYLEHTTSYNKGDLAQLWAGVGNDAAANGESSEALAYAADNAAAENIAKSAATDDAAIAKAQNADQEAEENDFSIKEILSAPAYNFWQEPAVEDKPEPEEEPVFTAADIEQTPVIEESPNANIDEEPFIAKEPELAEETVLAKEPELAEETVLAKKPDLAETTLADEETSIPVTNADAATMSAAEAAADEDDFAVADAAYTPTSSEVAAEVITAAPVMQEESASAFTEPVFIPKHLEEELCPVCGNPLEPDCAFCIICGTKVKDLPDDNAAQQQPAEPQPEIAAEQPKGKRRLFGRKKAAADELADAAAVAATAATAANAATAAQPDIFADNPRANTAPQAVATCPVCGAELEPGFAYCIICGEAVATANTTPPPANAPAQPAAPTQQATSAQPAASAAATPLAAAPNPDVVAAYRASTANAYAAAAVKGMLSDDAFVPPIQQAAYQPAASAAPPQAEQPAATPAAASQEQVVQEQTTVDYSAMTLQDILENVKALEKRILAEAEAANHNNTEQAPKAEQQ